MSYPRALHYATAIALASALPAAPAHADYTGNDILKDCDETTTWSTGACFGRVVGAIKGFQLMAVLANQPVPFCIRDNVTNGQMVDVVKAWLRNHPAERDYSFEVVVGLAAKDGFPCPAKK